MKEGHWSRRSPACHRLRVGCRTRSGSPPSLGSRAEPCPAEGWKGVPRQRHGVHRPARCYLPSRDREGSRWSPARNGRRHRRRGHHRVQHKSGSRSRTRGVRTAHPHPPPLSGQDMPFIAQASRIQARGEHVRQCERTVRPPGAAGFRQRRTCRKYRIEQCHIHGFCGTCPWG